MSGRPGLDELWGAIPPACRPAVGHLLRRIAHDLNTPLSTVTMEAYSATRLLQRLRTGTGSERATVSSELDDGLTNLRAATNQLAALVAALTALEGGES